MPDINVLPYQFDRNAEVLELLHSAFPSWPGGKEYFEWKYLDIEGDSIEFPKGWVVEKNGKIVAFNGYRPRLIKIGGKVYRCAESFDTATDPSCQGQGLFGMMQKKIYEKMSEKNIAFLYGWVSEIGYKAFTKAVAWRVWGTQFYMQKVLDTDFFLTGKVKNRLAKYGLGKLIDLYGNIRTPKKKLNIELKEYDDIPADAEALVRKVEHQFDTISKRTIHYLNWRIGSPLLKFVVVCAYGGEKLRGFVVYTTRERYLDIDDCFIDSQETLNAILLHLEDVARSKNSAMIRFRVNEKHVWESLFKNAGYFRSRTNVKIVGRAVDRKNKLALDMKKCHWTSLDRNE